MIEISNELLSEVLGYKAYVVKKEHIYWDTEPRDNDLVYERNEWQYCIDKDNLARKCKEWAFKQGYFLSSGYDITGAWCLDRVSNIVFVGYDDFYTEAEAIIKACEWIYKEINK